MQHKLTKKQQKRREAVSEKWEKRFEKLINTIRNRPKITEKDLNIIIK